MALHNVAVSQSKGRQEMKQERKVLWTYAYGKPRLGMNIHHCCCSKPLLQQVAAMHAALHALRQQYTSEGSMSSFKSTT